MAIEKKDIIKLVAILVCGSLLVIFALFLIPKNFLWELIETNLFHNFLYPLLPWLVFAFTLGSGIFVTIYGIYYYLSTR